jgi:hypothetical protein
MARKVHKTREGRQIPIASMEPDHLTNTCNMAFKLCIEARKAAAAGTDTLDSRLAGVRPMDVDEAVSVIERTMEEFHPYFLEAYLRGLDGPRKMLQAIYNRTEASNVVLPSFGDHLLADVIDEE